MQGDDESTREGGQKAVTKMITDDKIDLLTGGFSSAVVTAHQSIVAEHGVPYIITGASSSTVTRRTDINTSMMFHLAPITDASASKTTIFVDDVMRPAINEKFGRPADQPLRMAVIYQDSPFGKGALTSIKDTITAKGLKIQVVAEEPFKMGETDYRTILTSIKAKGPDVVYPIAFLNEEVPMLTQARRDVGLNTIFLAVECVDDPDYYKGLGEYGDYSIIESRFSAYATPKGPISATVEKYRKDYEARFGASPGMMGAATYEGVYVAAAALEQAGTLDRAALLTTLRLDPGAGDGGVPGGRGDHVREPQPREPVQPLHGAAPLGRGESDPPAEDHLAGRAERGRVPDPGVVPAGKRLTSEKSRSQAEVPGPEGSGTFTGEMK